MYQFSPDLLIHNPYTRITYNKLFLFLDKSSNSSTLISEPAIGGGSCILLNHTLRLWTNPYNFIFCYLSANTPKFYTVFSFSPTSMLNVGKGPTCELGSVLDSGEDVVECQVGNWERGASLSNRGRLLQLMKYSQELGWLQTRGTLFNFVRSRH